MCKSDMDSIINAKILANHFREICREYYPPYREADRFVNRQKFQVSNSVICFLSRTKKLINEKKVNAETFKNEIKRTVETGILHIEVLWFLEVLKLLPLAELIYHYESKNEEKVLEQISSEICENILNTNIKSDVFRKEMLLDYIRIVFESSVLETKNRIFTKCVTFVSSNLKLFYKCEETYSGVTLDLLVLMNLFDCAKLNQSTIQKFFQEVIINILEGSPHTVRFIVKKQENMKNTWKEHKILNIFRPISKYFDLTNIIEIIQKVLLDTSRSIDWDCMFCFISFIGFHYKDGWSSLKTVSNFLLTTSFKTFDTKTLSYAFFIARQGCFEKPNKSFPSYSQWFTSTFSSKTKLINNEKICNFFCNFLTDIVPYENAYYLKVHINRPPWVPAHCHSALDNYISIVKDHLCDLNISTELGICENVTEKSSTVFDVENVIQHFERTNEILNSVFQASLFCKEYYEKKFLVELLSKFEGKNSVRHKLITKLHSLGKIPNGLFKTYKSLEKKNK